MSITPQQPPTPTRAQKREIGRRVHRRETWVQMILPFLLALLFVIFLVCLVALPTDSSWRLRASVIADFMVTILVLCPAVLCMIPIFALMVAAIAGANKLHDSTRTPLERLETLTESMADRVENAAGSVNKRVINLNERIAPLMKIMTFFDTQQKDTQRREDNNGTESRQ